MGKTKTLSIKNVPEETVIRLRERARNHHRSLQGELSVILEEALANKFLTIEEISRRIRALDFHTPSDSTPSDSVDIIRADRDAR